MPRDAERGFSLIELMIVVAVVGILASISVTALTVQTRKARVAAVAADLRTFETGFVSFNTDAGDFPPDSHLDGTYHLPGGVGIEDYLPVERWADVTPLGGNYNWEGPDQHPYAGVAFFQPTEAVATFAMLDARIDDGDLSQGKFRVTSNGRYTYVIDE